MILVSDRERACHHRQRRRRTTCSTCTTRRAGRRHHGTDLPQRQGPQRHLGTRRVGRARHGHRAERPVRLRRLPGRHMSAATRPVAQPTAAPDWGIWGAGGATGGVSASPNTPGFARRVRRRLVRLLGQPGTYNCTATARGPGLRAGLLRHQHRQRPDDPELLHDLRRNLLGLAARSRRLHARTTTAPRSTRRARSDRRPPTMKELGLFLQSVAPRDKLATGRPGHPVIDRRSRSTQRQPDTGGRSFYFAMHNPSSATTDDIVHVPDQHDRRQATPCRSRGRCGSTVRTRKCWSPTTTWTTSTSSTRPRRS